MQACQITSNMKQNIAGMCHTLCLLCSIDCTAVQQPYRQEHTRGAGPRTTFPSLLYWLPWHGHLNFFSFCIHASMLRIEPHAIEQIYSAVRSCYWSQMELCYNIAQFSSLVRALTLFQGTTHPKCVHTAFRPYFSICPSSVTTKYVASDCNNKQSSVSQCIC